MKRLSLFVVLMVAILSLVTVTAYGETDLSKMPIKELQQLQYDISGTYKAYHTPTDSQKNAVLSATQNETQKYYSKKRIEVSGWAWYDSEYTYTRDWDFYTLKTHLDYKDSAKKSKKAIIESLELDNAKVLVLSYNKELNNVIRLIRLISEGSFDKVNLNRLQLEGGVV